MGNPVGRMNTTFCISSDNKNAYIFGLWCADGYHRSSSIGLTSVDKILIEEFRKFFLEFFPNDRIKMRIYSQDGSTGYVLKKSKQNAYQIYVNSRPLLRIFKIARENPKNHLKKSNLSAYFAGRFDGDGSVAENEKNDLRITYGYKQEAEKDVDLLRKVGFTPSVYCYQNSKTYVLYVSRFESHKFLNFIKPYRLRYRK